jgi:hypothetical protein
MPAQSQSLISRQPLSKGRGVAGHPNVISAKQIGNAFPLSKPTGCACGGGGCDGCSDRSDERTDPYHGQDDHVFLFNSFHRHTRRLGQLSGLDFT